MVQVDFSEYRFWSTCPVWWRNFVDKTLKDWPRYGRCTDERNSVLADAIAVYNGRIIDEESGSEEIDYLEFDTEDDFNAFKLIWIIHG